MAKFEKVAEFGIDSGQFMIIDPCYTLDADHMDIIKKAIDDHENQKTRPMKFQKAHYGLGVVGNSGGNGSFSVFERTLKNGTKQILINF